MSQEQKLISPETNLLKYKNPVRISWKDSSKNDDKELEGYDPRKICEMQSTESILASIMPPRRLEVRGELFIQEVSSAPASRAEVVQLMKRLDQQLEARGAKMTGICPVRRELFSQVSTWNSLTLVWGLFLIYLIPLRCKNRNIPHLTISSLINY